MSENLYTLHEIDNYSSNIHSSINLEDKPKDCFKKLNSFIEIIIVLDSKLLINVSNNTLNLNKGDILFIPSGTTHSFDYSSCIESIVFKANISLFNDIKSFGDVLKYIYPIIILSPEKDLEIYKEIKKNILLINTIQHENLITYEIRIYSLLLETLALITQKRTKNNIKSNLLNCKTHENIYIINEICDYITNHFTEKLTLDDISKISGFSKFHFSRLFKQYTNLTFNKYLNKQRIYHAESLLISREISIIDIALSSGFNSLSTFIRIFKQEKGCTPSEYRKKYI